MSVAVQDHIVAALGEAADSHKRWEHVYALHERDDQATFDAAAALLADDDPARRVLGADILGQLGARQGVPVKARRFRRRAGQLLLAALEGEQKPTVLSALAIALGHLAEERAVGRCARLEATRMRMFAIPSCSAYAALTMTLP